MAPDELAQPIQQSRWMGGQRIAPKKPAKVVGEGLDRRVALVSFEGEGGTITLHHAVGRDHMPWYERQRPALFGAALRGAKAALDPAGIMNPGVIVGRAYTKG